MDWAKDSRRALWIILSFAAFLFFFRLGDRPLRNPDEGRYAQIAATMERTGQWLEPKIFGVDYLRKPPLFYWMIALSFKVFGENEWSARAVPALFSLLGIAAAYFFTRRFFGNLAAAISCLLLIINPWYFHVGRFLAIDAVFSFFVVSSLYLFYAAQAAERRKQAAWYAGFYAAVALAFLTKGILALILPGLAIIVYALLTRQFVRILKESRLGLGLFVFFAVAAPWFLWMTVHKPAFWNVFFFREHLSRFTAQNFEHQEPWFFYPALIAAFLSPWIFFHEPLRNLAAKARENSLKNPIFFLLLFCATSILFLSASRSKLATYLLPAIAPACITIGAAWAQGFENSLARRKIFCIFFSIFTLSAYGVIFAMEAVNPEYSSKPLALAVKSKILPEDTVYVYDHPGPFYDFGFYLHHPVRPVGLEGELEISREDAGAREVSATRAVFMDALARGEHFYCVIRRSDWHDVPAALRPGLKILAQDKRKVLFESGAMPKKGPSS